MCDPTLLLGGGSALGMNYMKTEKRKDRERNWARDDKIRGEDREWYADQRNSNRDELTADASHKGSGGTA